jgi:hypothetical protein
MRVRSPIGDLPFRITGIRREGRVLIIYGELGTWRSEVRIGGEDVRAVARLAADGVRKRLRR